jgi:hypothetical protein
MCKCIDKITKLLKEQYGGTVSLDTAFSFNPESGHTKVFPHPIQFTYLKGNGRKRTKGSFRFTYCPFCGGEYTPRKVANYIKRKKKSKNGE